jgi:hypothetical protein
MSYSSLFYTNVGYTPEYHSPSPGFRWYGRRTNFPGFNYKKKPPMGPKTTSFHPGARTSGTTSQNIENVYIPGSGVGAKSKVNRRVLYKNASTCCGNNMGVKRTLPNNTYNVNNVNNVNNGNNVNNVLYV